MSADKHPAEVLAGWHDSMPYVPNSFGHKTAEMLRRIPALEAERDQLRAEVESLRADAERYAWVRTADCLTLERIIYRSDTPDEFDAAVDKSRKQQ